MIKKITIYLSCLCAALSAFGKSNSLDGNAIAAVAEQKVITVDDLKSEMRPYIARVQQTASSEAEFNHEISKIEKEVLQSLIDRILIVKEFDRIGGKIPKYYIENELDDRIKLHFNGDRAAFVQFLESEGKTLKQYQNELEDHLIVSIMTNKIKSNLGDISPKKIEEYYEKHTHDFFDAEKIHLRQITIAQNNSSEMKEALSELKKGKPFAEIASIYGKDEMKSRNGDWGWVYAEDMLPELSKKAFALKPGSYSDPIELNNHIFILYVEAKEKAGAKSLAAVRKEIEDKIEKEQTWKAQQKWLEELRSKAFVKYYVASN